jgi:hypothetical protein
MDTDRNRDIDMDLVTDMDTGMVTGHEHGQDLDKDAGHGLGHWKFSVKPTLKSASCAYFVIVSYCTATRFLGLCRLMQTKPIQMLLRP